MEQQQETLVKKKVVGYLRKLNREQIIEAAKMATEGAFYPDIAHKYEITLCECVGLLQTEQVGKQNIRYKKYGKKTYSYTDANVHMDLQRLWAEGYDDDQIAELWESNCAYIARLRSYHGIVAYNRVVAKGHSSPHEFKHGIDSENGTTTIKVSGSDTIATMNEDRKPHQGQIEFNDNEIVETMDNKERVAVLSSRETKLFPSMPTNIPKLVNHGLMVLLHEERTIKPGIARALTNMVDWQQVAIRLQNTRLLYKVVGRDFTYYFEQFGVDAVNAIVELRLVHRISANQVKS